MQPLLIVLLIITVVALCTWLAVRVGRFLAANEQAARRMYETRFPKDPGSDGQ